MTQTSTVARFLQINNDIEIRASTAVDSAELIACTVFLGWGITGVDLAMLADRTHGAKRNRCQQTQRTFDWQQDTIGVEESSFMFSIADTGRRAVFLCLRLGSGETLSLKSLEHARSMQL